MPVALAFIFYAYSIMNCASINSFMTVVPVI